MGSSEETVSGDVHPKESSLPDIASGNDRQMERLQAAAECLMYLQGDKISHQQNSGADVFRSQQPDPSRNFDRDLNPDPLMCNNKRLDLSAILRYVLTSMSGTTHKKPTISV